jgi:hypothetical protein
MTPETVIDIVNNITTLYSQLRTTISNSTFGNSNEEIENLEENLKELDSFYSNSLAIAYKIIDTYAEIWKEDNKNAIDVFKTENLILEITKLIDTKKSNPPKSPTKTKDKYFLLNESKDALEDVCKICRFNFKPNCTSDCNVFKAIRHIARELI